MAIGERVRDALRTGALLVAAGACIAAVRAPLAKTHHHIKEKSDVNVLPAPEQVVRLSLGFRAALADLLWSHVLVEQGLHTQDNRRYDTVANLLDAINALDPSFRDPYLLTDALITFQVGTTSHAEVVKAREIMERGVKNRPDDAELWLVLGQFTGFIAPGTYLTDPAEQKQWTEDGARFLARAAELGGADAKISWAALGGAGLLHRAGQRDAEIRFLRRALAVTDDDELKDNLKQKLAKLLGEREYEAYVARDKEFGEKWRRDLPFVDKTMMLLLGPPPDTAYCAGGEHAEDARCATTWEAWARRLK